MLPEVRPYHIINLAIGTSIFTSNHEEVEFVKRTYKPELDSGGEFKERASGMVVPWRDGLLEIRTSHSSALGIKEDLDKAGFKQYNSKLEAPI